MVVTNKTYTTPGSTQSAPSKDCPKDSGGDKYHYMRERATSYDDHVRFSILSNKFRTNRNKNVVVVKGKVLLNYALPLHSLYVAPYYKEEAQYGLNACMRNNRIIKYNTSIPFRSIKHLIYKNKRGVFFLNHIAFGKIKMKESHAVYIIAELAGKYNDKTIVNFIKKSYTNQHITQYRLSINWSAPTPHNPTPVRGRITPIGPLTTHSTDTRTDPTARIGPRFTNPESLQSPVKFVNNMLNKTAPPTTAKPAVGGPKMTVETIKPQTHAQTQRDTVLVETSPLAVEPRLYQHVPPPRSYDKFDLRRAMTNRLLLDRLVVAIINIAITFFHSLRQVVAFIRTILQLATSIISIPSRIITRLLPYRPGQSRVKRVHKTTSYFISLTSPYIIDKETKIPTHAISTQTDKFMLGKHPDMSTQTETVIEQNNNNRSPPIIYLVALAALTYILFKWVI